MDDNVFDAYYARRSDFCSNFAKAIALLNGLGGRAQPPSIPDGEAAENDETLDGDHAKTWIPDCWDCVDCNCDVLGYYAVDGDRIVERVEYFVPDDNEGDGTWTTSYRFIPAPPRIVDQFNLATNSWMAFCPLREVEHEIWLRDYM